MNTSKLQMLQEFPWEDHYPGLVAIADHIIQGKSWNMELIPKGQTAESIVQDVIDKTITGQRNWDPDRGPLLMWLKWVIRSDISHLATSAAHRSEVHSDKFEEEDSEDEAFEAWVYQSSLHNSENESPEDKIINVETETERNEIARAKIEALLEVSNGKPELEAIVFAMIDGNCSSKPQDLAAFLGKPVKIINQNLRTLRRKAANLRIEGNYEGK